MRRDPDFQGAHPPAAAGNFAPVRCLPSCTGCGACVAACPLRALSLVSEQADGFGRKAAAIDAARCTGCGACLPACPRQALVMSTPPWTLP